jgi:hypothetical protein
MVPDLAHGMHRAAESYPSVFQSSTSDFAHGVRRSLLISLALEGDQARLICYVSHDGAYEYAHLSMSLQAESSEIWHDDPTPYMALIMQKTLREEVPIRIELRKENPGARGLTYARQRSWPRAVAGTIQLLVPRYLDKLTEEHRP